MKSNLYLLFKYLIGWPLSVVALIFVVNIIFSKTSNLTIDFSQINIFFLIISISLFVIYFFLRSYLWMLILGENAKHLSFKENLLHWSTSELKRYIPGNIWSFVSRATSFEKETLSKKQVLILIAHEAVIIVISSLFISLFYIWNFSNNVILGYISLFLFLISVTIFLFSFVFLSKLKNQGKIESIAKLFLESRSFFDNLSILLLGIFTFFIFSLATYFSVVSLTYIDLKYFLPLVSLFGFSLFVGYISIVTPMGLGVREAVATTGLTLFIAQSLAAFASIFVRIIFIISELISLFIVILWTRLNFPIIKQTEEFIAKHKHEILLVIFVLIYIAYYSIASFLRYDNFYTGRFDLGNMDQTVWNTLNGRFFLLTDPDGVGTVSRLSIHADSILMLISPFYLLWSDPRMLLFIQTFILGFGAIFIYLIAKEVLKNKNISLAFASAFLLNPAVGFTNLYDFHPVTLATTFLLITFYFYLKRRYLYFLLFACLAGVTKEEVWAIIGIFGLFIAIRSFLEQKNKHKLLEIIFGICLFFAGFILSYALIFKIMPFIRGGDHFALSYYSDFGDSSLEIIKNIIFNPIKTFSVVIEQSRLLFLSQLLFPLGLLSLLSPVFLLFAAPDLTINLLSNNIALHQIYYQYSATITPFIFISAVYSCKLLINKFKRLELKHLAVYILIATLISLYYTGPLLGSKKSNIDMFSKQLQNKDTINKFLSSIPSDYAVSATNNAGSHLSQRENIYTIPMGIHKADILVFLIDHGWSKESLGEQKIMIENFKRNQNFELIFEDKDFFVFKKRGLNLRLENSI